MTNDELDRLEALEKAAQAGYGRWLGDDEETLIRSVPALVKAVRDRDAEIARLRALVEAAYLEGHEAGWDGREPFGDVWDGSKSKRALDP